MKQKLTPKKTNRPLRILLETGDGRSASAILENNFLQHCLDLGAEVHVLSPGACFESFVERYRLPGTDFSYLPAQLVTKMRHRSVIKFEKRLGNMLAKFGLRRTRNWLWHFLGARAHAADAYSLESLVEIFRPDCVVTAHLNQGFSRGLIGLCRLKRIPTIGNVFSWDHPYYPQRARPDWLTCWSEIMRDNLINIGGFLPERIESIGAPVFDPYFDPAGTWTRKELCGRLGLDPARPILLFATLGQMQMFLDETGTFRSFLEALDNASLPGPPQVVLRLHPISVDHYFDEFHSRKDVVFSRYMRYIPGMRWCPSRDEIFLAGNLLRHADVCISPGSTMTIEAAIFDTPTIVPTFNPIMPEEYNTYFKDNWLKKHFQFLVKEDTVALANSPDELMESIRKTLADPSWLAEGRKLIREKLLGPLDGRATERLARIAVKLAKQKKINA